MEPALADRQHREYLSALRGARIDAARARRASEPVLVRHHAALARLGFEYARAVRTGDYSKTSIRPSWMLRQMNQRAAA